MMTVLTEAGERISAAVKADRERDAINEASKWADSEFAELLIEALHSCDEWDARFTQIRRQSPYAENWRHEFKKMVSGLEDELDNLRVEAIRDHCSYGEDYDNLRDEAERLVTSVQDAISNYRQSRTN